MFNEVRHFTLYGLQSTFFPGECSTRLCGHKQAQENTAEKNSSVKTSVYSLSRSIAACASSILLSCLIPSPTQPGNETTKLSSRFLLASFPGLLRRMTSGGRLEV